MGDLMQGREAVAHLLRRAGFGHSHDSVALLADVPYEELVDSLLADLEKPAPPDPEGFDAYVPGAIQDEWLRRMIAGEAPLAEKLALFWHGHFATSNVKVQDAQLLWNQYQVFRGQGGGRFRDLVLAVSRDVAMIRWLDGNANRKGHPNENYARELQELFTLGVGNYSEEDIREIARAFTGWGSRHHEFRFASEFHDDGIKRVHGREQNFGGEEVVDLLCSLPACHSFIAGKLLRFFSHPDPSEAEVAELAAVLEGSDGDVAATLRHLFLSEGFLRRDRQRALVKSPVEFAVSGLRACRIGEAPLWVHGSLDRMGQILFRPPSVKGWTSGVGWLSAAGMVERLGAARRLAEAAPEGVAGDLLDVAFEGALPDSLSEMLRDLDGRARVTAVLASPEFQLA